MPPAEHNLTPALLRLWDAGSRGIAAAGRAAPITPAILKNLRAHGCLIEESLGAGSGGGGAETSLELLRAGLGCYRDLIQAIAARNSWSIGRKAVVYHRTASTNDVCWRHAAHASARPAGGGGPGGGPGGEVAIADVQSRGRGRRGNSWSARPGQSVLMSILLRNVSVAGVDRLTLLAGLAAAEALEAVLHERGGARIGRSGPHAVQIKWPNDLLLASPHGRTGAHGDAGGARKVAGILVERRGPHAVLGIGVNVAQGPADFPADISNKATSLYMYTGQQIDRLRVIVALLEAFNRRCAAITDNDAWIAQWKARCPMLGQRICARELGPRRTPAPRTQKSGPRDIVGLVQDVDPLHGLLVRDSSGAMHWLAAQTTTLSS